MIKYLADGKKPIKKHLFFVLYGENIESDDFNGDEPLSEKTFSHPVKCHDLIISEFNNLKNEAKILLEKRNNLDLNTFVSQIIYIDATLYHLLEFWQAADIDHDYSSYNPEEIKLKADYEYYFNEDNKGEFSHLRLVSKSGKQ